MFVKNGNVYIEMSSIAIISKIFLIDLRKDKVTDILTVLTVNSVIWSEVLYLYEKHL